MLDASTRFIKPESISHRVLATVISYYLGRRANGSDEAMIDVRGLAMSQDTCHRGIVRIITPESTS